MGINLGALLLAAGLRHARQVYGWHYGFGAAGVGMLIGLVVYLVGQKYLAADNMMQARRRRGRPRHAAAARRRTSGSAIVALVVLCALNIVFWARLRAAGQHDPALGRPEHRLARLSGWEMPSTWFQSLNPLFIFLFAPLLDMLLGPPGEGEDGADERRPRWPSAASCLGLVHRDDRRARVFASGHMAASSGSIGCTFL